MTTAVYAASVDNLFGSRLAIKAIGTGVLAFVLLTVLDRPCLTTVAIQVAVALVVTCCLVLIGEYRRWKRRGGGPPGAVARWEVGYAVVGMTAMFVLGSACAHIVEIGDGRLALISSIIVVMSMAVCTAEGDRSRPRLVSQQLAAIFIPYVAALLLVNSVETVVVSCLILVYYVATMVSARTFYAAVRNARTSDRRATDLSRQIKRSTDLFDTAVNNMTSGLLLFDIERRLVVANDRVKELLGRDLIERMIGQETSVVCDTLFAVCRIGEKEADRIFQALQSLIDGCEEGAIVLNDYRRNKTFELRVRVIPERGIVLNVDDITEKRIRDAEVSHLAHHDILTSLPNRLSLNEYLEQRAKAPLLDGAQLVLMYMDLDRFKIVNDELGHQAGDELLVQAADRLKLGRSDADYVARIAGDEFVVVFDHAGSLATVELIARRIIETISLPYMIAERTVAIGASAGLSVVGSGPYAALEALRTADVALYESKVRGRNRVLWFEPSMDDRAKTRRAMAAELRLAVATGSGLDLHYQPIVDFRTGRVVTCEALMRWTSATFGSVPPSVFIPLAEESDLIQKLGAWSLRRACLDAQAWGAPDVKVAVNMSGSQLKYSPISRMAEDALTETALDPSRLEIEFTESVLADDLETMRREMEALARLGVSLALDDFGTGFSSLSLLHKLPLDRVKLDRSFVAQLDSDPSAVNLIASIVQMTQALQKQLVIEGVETASQLALIAIARGRLIQGFYITRPLAQQNIIGFLADNRVDSRAGLLKCA